MGGGSGVFTDSGQSLGISRTVGVALGDLDIDGDLDAFTSNLWPQANKVWLNEGMGTFSDSGQNLGSSSSSDVALGDVDGDGDLDAFIPNTSLEGNRMWLNDGTGVFSDSGQSLGNLNSNDVELGDVDGDGDLDAFVGNWNGQANKVWLNDGTGIFIDSGQSLSSLDSFGVALGDVDGDGDLDAFVANRNQANKVWLNDGMGVFIDSGQILGSSWSVGVALGDVDGDGDLDAVIGNENSQASKVWLNNGAGIFTDSGQSLVSLNSSGGVSLGGVTLGDVDGDGDLDAFFGIEESQANKVWLNNGAGIFTDSGQDLGNSRSRAVALGDVDGDGDLDAFVANRDQANKVWLNGLDQTPPILSITKAGPSTVATGEPITYTLTATNGGNLTATNLVITDTIPTGATYVGGGVKVGNVVSWTIPSLSPGISATVEFVVTATQTISNFDYAVRADGGYGAVGVDTVTTYILEGGGPQPSFSISGVVADDAGSRIPGVTVLAVSGGSGTTDASGVYTISNLITGTYTLTPTKSGYTFSPISRMVSVPPDATGQDFVGASSVVTDTIDPILGGVITTTDNSVSLSFPGEAVTTTTTVTLTTANTTTHTTGGFKFIGQAFSVNATDADGDPVTNFNKPFTLTVTYEDTDWQNAGITNESNLNLYFWNGATWEAVLPCDGCVHDTIGNKFTIILDHLTDFAILTQADGGGSNVYLPIILKQQ